MNLTKRQLTTQSLTAGAGLIRERFGLVVLLYTFDLAVALLLAIPVYSAFVEHVGYSGFGADLIQGFDLILWREIADLMTDVLQGIGLQLLWVIPIYWVWKTAAQMGVIYALHQGAIWPFWRGVGYYTPKGLLLSLAFAPLKVLGVVVAVFMGVGLQSVWGGEVGGFWSMGVLTPFLMLSVLAMLDLFQRYAQIAVVVRHDTIGRALNAGFSWPIKYGAASYLYLIWYAIALVVLVVTQLLNATLHVGVSAIVAGFLIQQVSLFTRSAVRVGWTGSEVSLFERTHISELPLIADAEEIDFGGDAAGFDDSLGGVAFT